MRLALAILLLSAAATPAIAQREMDTGSHISVPARARIPEGAMSKTARARLTVAQFARCVVDRDTKGVERTLALPQGPDYGKALNRLATDECLAAGEVRMPYPVMRAAIFVELYRRYDRKKAHLVAVPPLDLTQAATNPAETGQLALLAFGDCVVKADAGIANAVVLSPTASVAQDVAFKALSPLLGRCIYQGQQISFSKPILEGVLAEVLLRQAATPALQKAAAK